MRRRASWSSRYELTLWSARQQAHELSDKLRACQGDDTMTVSRHRQVVTQPLYNSRKFYLLISELLYHQPLTTSDVEAPGLWHPICFTQGGQQ